MSDFLISYASIIALKNNLPDTSNIEEYYIDQFEEALEDIRDVIGDDAVDKFQIDPGEVKPIVTRMNGATGEKRYSSKRYVAREKLMTKIDAALNYLQLQSPPEEKKKIMGFHAQED